MNTGDRVVLPDGRAGFILGWQGLATALVMLHDDLVVAVPATTLRGVPRRTSVRNHLTSEAEISYDQRAGSSSKSARIAPDARLSATTRETGVVASIEVVAR